MDAPDIDAGEHLRALRGLARLNRLSRCDAILWPALRDLAARTKRPIRVLDVATGSGDVPLRLAQRARRHGIEIEWHGCDVSARAVDEAAARARRSGMKFTGHVCDVLKGPLPGRFDAVTCGLFLHHLDEADVIRAITAMSGATERLLLISDLRRTLTGLALARIVPRLVTRSRVVWFDAAVSARAAWSIEELRTFASEAGLRGAHVRRAWPQRMLLTWERGTQDRS